MGWKHSFLKNLNKDFIVNLEIAISGSFCLHRNIITIAVFYALPVIQLVITYQTVSAALTPRTHALILQGESFAVMYRERYNLGLVQKLISHLGSNWTSPMLHLWFIIPNYFIRERLGTTCIVLSTNSKLLPCTHSVIVSINCAYDLPVWTLDHHGIMSK